MSANQLLKKARLGAVSLVATTLAGCASIEYTSPGMMDGLDVVGGDTPALQSICVRNYGFDLFYAFTIICGDVDYDPVEKTIKGGCLLFQDKCNCSDCYRTMQALANAQGKVLTNVSMFNNSLPTGGITGDVDILGFLFESEDVGCSGVLRAR